MRIRHYESSGAQYLEVKTRDGRGLTHKFRREHNGQIPLTRDSLGFISNTLCAQQVLPPTPPLRPSLVSSYRRVTLYLPQDEARATIDLGLVCSCENRSVSFPGLAIIETKTGVRPTQLDWQLRANGYRQSRFSKYGVGLALSHPQLSALKWKRTLNHTLQNKFNSNTKEEVCYACL